MIIDSSYFINKLALPQVGNPEGLIAVNSFIQQYEPEFLQCALGYDLWQAFVDGIEDSLPEDRWIKLLFGDGKWKGFSPVIAGENSTIVAGGILALTVGGPDLYDPAPGNTFILPPTFSATGLEIEVRGTGTLMATEWSIDGDGVITLPNMLNVGAVIFLRSNQGLSIISDTAIKLSPIANYVFYQFMDHKAVDFVLTGNVVSSTENNRTVNGMDRMVDTWNRMVDMNYNLFVFLRANKALYPEWKECSYFPSGNPIRWFLYWGWDDRHEHENCCYNGCASNVFKKKNSYDL